MAYVKVTACIVVDSESEELATQYLNDCLDRKGERFVTYREEITSAPSDEPENAGEIRQS